VHHLAARDFGPARQALLAAAEEHYAVHAYRDTARALRTALEHWPSGEQDDSRLAVIDRLARCAEMCSEYADAVMLLRELADRQERRGDSRALAGTCRRLALAHELRGQWESALTAREAAAVAFSAAGIPAEAAADRLAMAAHLRSAASFSAALATLSAASADAQASGRADLLLRIQGLCVLDDAAGAHGAAADRARQILARLARTQERHYSVPILQWLATFFTEQGLAADTSACAAALSQIAEATAQPEAIAALAHARGEALMADQPQAAAHELRTAAEMFSRLDLPLQAAQAQHRAAAASAQLGEHAHALELLHAAHATADQLGARRLRESCTAALRQLGDKPRRHPYSRRVTAGLTSRELNVMQLVAQGNTSRQIGRTLFISPRTVEMHVHSSMQKLQCRTRAEAVRRLTELRALPQQDTARAEPG
jgi:DNA-binding CsgD family transcriptional regulator